MSHRIVGQQIAPYVQENGGASVHAATGKQASGPGFMVSEDGSERRVEGTSPTPEQIDEYADQHFSRHNPPDAVMGVWGNVMDKSRKVPSGVEMRRTARENRQEAAYALGSENGDGGAPTRINRTMTTDDLNRPYGADVLTNLVKSPKDEESAFIDTSRLEADTIRPKEERLFGRTDTLNDISLNEVENDTWSATNRNNPRRLKPETPFSPGHPDEKRRENYGDVVRTINRGRMNAVRGVTMVAHPDKGWHHNRNEVGERVGPSKVRRNPDDGERTPVEYSDALESERAGFPPRELTSDEQAEREYAAAADLHRLLSPRRDND